jgi:hypothetical protein
MKTMLYMLAVKEKDKCANPWIIRATSEEYSRMLEQYKNTGEDRLLIVWNLMSGVRIIRADLENFKMHEDFSNISFPFDNLAGWWRAGLWLPVANAIEEFIKKEDE